jgi:hypothetical protein
MQPRFAKAKDGEALEEWRELNARWFQFSTFCPILHVHGTDRPRVWDEATKTLMIERRAGSFPGMIADRTFNVVLVSPDRSVAYSASPQITRSVPYRGQPVRVRF